MHKKFLRTGFLNFKSKSFLRSKTDDSIYGTSLSGHASKVTQGAKYARNAEQIGERRIRDAP